MTDEQDDRAERYLELAEGVVRLLVALTLVALVVWSVAQEPGNDSDWSMDAVRLGLFLTAVLVLVRAPGVRWPKG
jgi:hypothetical protein